jgi:hypothetical protein
MGLKREVLLPLLVRLVIAIPLFILGFFLLSKCSRAWNDYGLFFLLGGIFSIVVSCVMVSPTLARFFGMTAGGIFFPVIGHGKHGATFSIPRAMRAKGNFMDALKLYDDMLKEHPREVQIYLDMIEIAKNDLTNMTMARKIGERAKKALKKEEDLKRIEMRITRS